MSDALSPNETTAILAYLDGELSPAEASDVEALLQRNVSARVLLKSLTVQKAALERMFQLPESCPRTHALVAQVLAG